MEGFIDSGTTLSYFPKNIYQLFIASINKYCEKPSKCLRRDKSFIGWDKSQCFLKLPETEMSDFYDSFPLIIFQFGNKGTYTWFPRNYFYQSQEKPGASYCIGVIRKNIITN